MKNKLTNLVLNLILFKCLILILNGCNEHIIEIDDNNNVSNTNYVAKESFTHTFPVTNQSQLRLSGINGNVTISGSSFLNSVIIEGEKRVGSESLRDAQAHLPELKVNIQNLTSEFFVQTSQPDKSYGRSYIIDYLITIPDNFKISVDNINGSIIVDSLNNNVRINNVNGSVVLNKIYGSANVSLVNGLITSSQTLPLNGTIDYTVVNGNIELNIPQTTSADFYASVVNGNISLNSLLLHNNIVRTNSVSGELGNGEGMISLETTNGNIFVAGY